MELKDKVVVITGGTKGFGRALAEVFLAEGSRVVICSHNKEEVEKTASQIGAMGIFADVINEKDMNMLADETEKKFGHIDIWVNNAGIWLNNENAENNDLAQVKTMVDVNVVGLINGSIIALRKMKPKNNGVIMNVLSGAALGSRPGIATYSATKWAGKGLTDALREENKNTNLKFISICPGGMKTTIFGNYHYADYDKFLEPHDVALKVIENLKKENSENELVIRRQNA
jgi:NADP-dependent 3-hydroxy acid dehydrogenase YdfG